MNKKYSEEIITVTIKQYGGQSVALLCAEYGVPRSTTYSCISQYRKPKSLQKKVGK